ncbi:MAG: glycosyltransferase family 2 protein, partial [Candidatus Omnitrophica bacterium]|nr:glycosyltransferase family 2 protein [Candidatus Omnitrophota bacterium]
DGSTDGTREILKQIPFSSPSRGEGKGGGDKGDTKIILKEKNEGKGSAIREGLKNATGDVVVIQDADMEYDPMDWLEMLKVMKEKNASVVYGSRFLCKDNEFPFLNRTANRFLTLLTNMLFFAKTTDMETCYKLCSKELLLSLNLKTNSFEIEPEITCKILKSGCRIEEVPVVYRPRNKTAGKKIGWKDGFKAVYYIIKYRFVS